jgi:hypothetical protein
LVVIDVVGHLVFIDFNKKWLSLMSTYVMGVFEKSPKWSPYGVSLSMALIGRHFEEVYKKPIGVVMKYEFV